MASLSNCLKTALSVSRAKFVSHICRPQLNNRLNTVRLSSKVYEADGKTHAILLNDDSGCLMINSFSEVGFSLNNGIKVLGPIAFFPNCVLSWNVGDISQINEQALTLFLLLQPKLDIFVLGIPEFDKKNKACLNRIFKIFREKNIQIEILSTESACATLNFLLVEQRFVGAGILPPIEVTADEAMAVNPTKMGYVRPEHK